MKKTINYPKIGEIAELVRSIKPAICDSYVEFEGDTPSICLTIGHNPETGAWSYQTGDNSYTGGAYGYPNWAVGYVTRRCDSHQVARDLIAELHELAHP